MIEVIDYYTEEVIPYTKFRFPGGELQVRFEQRIACQSVRVKWQYQSDAELVEVALIKDALCQMGVSVFLLDIPYLPYARQDRVCSTGESFALQVFAELVNALDFDLVTCHDPHNEKVFRRLFNSTHVVSQADLCFATLGDEKLCDDIDVIVFPDEGSLKKYDEYKPIIDTYVLVPVFGSKIRNPETGALTGFDVDRKDFDGLNVLVVDDICDGGGTFLGLGAVLKERNCGKLSLFTTHGIYSKGLDALNEMFDGGVFCTYRKLSPI